jgi:hypothetical protein
MAYLDKWGIDAVFLVPEISAALTELVDRVVEPTYASLSPPRFTSSPLDQESPAEGTAAEDDSGLALKSDGTPGCTIRAVVKPMEIAARGGPTKGTEVMLSKIIRIAEEVLKQDPNDADAAKVSAAKAEGGPNRGKGYIITPIIVVP